MRKYVKGTILVALILILTLTLILFYIEKGRERPIDHHAYPGEKITYKDSKLHYYLNGEGQTTVVFLSGNGTALPYSDMHDLHHELSETTQVLVYDRPGHGWSDISDSERTVKNRVDELRHVLEANQNPVILVAHSMASLDAIHYSQLYSEDVQGIVLIDGVTPEYAANMENLVPLSLRVTRMFGRSGILRGLSSFDFIKNSLLPKTNYPEEMEELVLDFTISELWNDSMIEEREHLNEDGRKVISESTLGDVPLSVISARDNPMAGWPESQEEFSDWSTQVKHIWVETDNHFIHHENQDIIRNEINQLLEE